MMSWIYHCFITRWEDLLYLLRFFDHFMTATHRRVEKGTPPSLACVEELQLLRETLRTQRRWGYLYQSYKPRRVYWEGVVFLRKIGMAMAAAVGAGRSNEVSILVAPIVLLIIALVLNLWFKPFRYTTILCWGTWVQVHCMYLILKSGIEFV